MTIDMVVYWVVNRLLPETILSELLLKPFSVQ